MALPVRVLVSAQGYLAEQAQQLSQPWLSAQEMERWQSLGNDARKLQFLACRYALRTVLVSAEQPFHMWHLSAQAGAAPRVIQNDAQGEAAGGLGAPPSLSLAHSQNYVVCASAENVLGVDLEVQPSRRTRNVYDIAHLVCSSVEMRILRAKSDATLVNTIFLKYWVLKEALFKYRGTGLDFQRIRDISCYEGNVANKHASVLGYAWMWEAKDVEGRVLTWAICTQKAITLQDIDLVLDPSLTCTRVQSWVLVQTESHRL